MFFPTPTHSPTPGRCPTIQFRVRHYLSEVRVRSHRLGARFDKTPSTSDANQKTWGDPRLPTLVSAWATHREVPWPPPEVITAHITQGNYCYLPICYMKTAMIKDTAEHADEEECRMTSRRFPNPGALACHPLPVEGCVHTPGRSQNLSVQGFSWRRHHIGVMNY